MLTKAAVIFIFLTIHLHHVSSLKKGDPCEVRGKPGICEEYVKCPAAKADLANNLALLKCSSSLPIVVCCPSSEEVYAISHNNSECPPIGSNYLKIQKDGRGKARDKCIGWLDLIYRCVDGVPFPGFKAPKIRKDECNHPGANIIIDGEAAKEKEFPHQAILGYIPENNRNEIKWDCGGSLISDQWVLTAAHCIWNTALGYVEKVNLGTVTVQDSNLQNIYDVEERLLHPSYVGSKLYDDLGLVKLNKKVTFSEYIIPICLDYEGLYPDKAVATGFGMAKEDVQESRSNVLLKVSLNHFEHSECTKSYPKSTKKPDGLNANTQICYGSRKASKDTCHGDSGGPLQILNKNVYCTYILIGVASFGIDCGNENIPGVYTRVYPYLDWIESVVWP